MRNPRFVPILTAMLVLTVTSADALDNNRRGFVVGFGAGWGSATQELSTSGGGLDLSLSSSTGGVATDFRIGHGFNERWLLYYTNQQVFFGLNGDSYAQGLTGIGCMHFFSPQAPALLVEAALGAGVLWNADARDSESGFGLLLGFGYEFARHFQIKADWYYAELNQATIGEVDYKSTMGTFRITLNWLGY